MEWCDVVVHARQVDVDIRMPKQLVHHLVVSKVRTMRGLWVTPDSDCRVPNLDMCSCENLKDFERPVGAALQLPSSDLCSRPWNDKMTRSQIPKIILNNSEKRYMELGKWIWNHTLVIICWPPAGAIDWNSSRNCLFHLQHGDYWDP